MTLPNQENSVIIISGRSPLEEIGGGHCSYVRAHAWAATEAGYDVHIFCVSNETTQSIRQPYGTVHHVSANGAPPRQRYIGKLANPLASSVVKQREVWERAAAVHSFGVYAYAGCLAVEQIRPYKQLRHVMNMYTVYHVEVFAQFRALKGLQLSRRIHYLFESVSVFLSASRCEKYAYRHCDTLAVNYRCVKDLVTSHLGQHKDFRIVPYGPESDFADVGAYDEIPDEQVGRPVVMTIALQRPKKGVRTFLEALAILKEEGVEFVGRIAGGGEMRDDNMRYMRELGLENDVEFLGFVDDVEPWLDAADIYVQPSLREESGSLAMLEAMRNQLPVICTGIDGMAEDIRNGIDGLTVPPNEPGTLAAAIKRLILNREEREQFAHASGNRFADRHGKAIFSRSMKELYESHSATPTRDNE